MIGPPASKLRIMGSFFRSFNTMTESTLSLGKGILDKERHALAKAITLIESTRLDHKAQSDLLMEYLALNRKIPQPSLRIGIAGPPGAGKSTFIEQLGIRYISQGKRVSVIPVDPSSHISGGSILGDKTRMDVLSRSEHAYVRASPTRGVLGGIAEHTSDVITLCESAGYDVVIVESVGLGQSEVDIDSAVDMLVLIVPPGGGDSLQAAKKGIMEATDLVIVNKADGALLESATHTKADYSGAMHFIRQKNIDWRAKVLMVSARTGLHMDDVEKEIAAFHSLMIKNGGLQSKRNNQALHWMRGHFRRLVFSAVENSPNYQSNKENIERQLCKGQLPPRVAASMLYREIQHK